MLTILFYVVIAIIAISIIATLLKFVGEFLLGIIGIGIILAAVIFFGPLIWSVVTRLFSLVLDFLPLILALLVGLAILGAVAEAKEKRKYLAQSKKINQLGIDKIENGIEAWKNMANLNLVELAPDGYVVSTDFYKRVANSLGNIDVLSLSELGRYCTSCTSHFQVSYMPQFSDFLQKKSIIFKFRLTGGEACFLTQTMMHKCEKIFLQEGAATKEELLVVFRHAGILRYFPKDEGRITEFFLTTMVLQEKAKRVELDDLGDTLYVSTEKRNNSKMVRREITLD